MSSGPKTVPINSSVYIYIYLTTLTRIASHTSLVTICFGPSFAALVGADAHCTCYRHETGKHASTEQVDAGKREERGRGHRKWTNKWCNVVAENFESLMRYEKSATNKRKKHQRDRSLRVQRKNRNSPCKTTDVQRGAGGLRFKHVFHIKCLKLNCVVNSSGSSVTQHV